MNTALYFRYWGKADPNYPGEPKWHPLVYHSLDVAACGVALLDCKQESSRALSRLSGLQQDVLHSWLRFLFAVHDIGKFADGFQCLRDDLQQTLQGRVNAPGGMERHDTLGHVLGMKRLLGWLGHDGVDPNIFDLLQPWLAAVTGHHGRPPRNPGGTALLLRNQFPQQVLEDAHRFVAEIAALFLPNGFPLPPPEAGMALRYQQTSWLVAGIAVVADWLGSNTRWFPYRAPERGLADYWHDIALPQARRAVVESGLVPAASTRTPAIRTLFPRLTSPTPLQAWVETVPIANGPQVFVLEELTGSGKTEAALTLAGRLMAAGEGQGVYLALPTMATADAMFDRIRGDDAWRRFFDGDAQLALAHSADWLKLKLEDLNRRDAGYGHGEETSASRHCTTWLADNRKKALLADFGVGTVDQALLSVLPVRHQSLRLLGIANKVLIVDEIHACDCYMTELLARLLRFHAALGGSAILLSATLPLNQRVRYLGAFAQGAGISATEPKATAYPLATHFSAAGLTEQPVESRQSAARHVAVMPLADESTVFEWLQNVVQQRRCAVWVRNTVVDAVQAWQTWNAAYPGCPATLFHARFALWDRLRIGKEIEAAFGPKSGPSSRRGRMVIATQVIEQSLDVDFDDMVTDLAPIDLIVQRAGRLQRHHRDAVGNRLTDSQTSDGRGGARLAVLMPEPKDDAGKDWMTKLLPKGGKVYPDHGKLWLTARWLDEQRGFKLPRQAREMIETVYDEKAFDRLPEGLKGISQRADGACRADASHARGNVLAFDEGYSPSSLRWQDEGETPTRLGEVTVRVRLGKVVNDALVPWAETGTGIDWALSELTVPRRLIAGESARREALVKRARDDMSDEGRYVVMVALKPHAQVWRGHAVSIRGEEVHVAYSSVTGLTIEKGAEDESDQ